MDGKSLYIDGKELPGGRFLVRIDGRDCPIPYVSFVYLVKLAYARRFFLTGSIDILDLGAGDAQHKVLYRMRRHTGLATSADNRGHVTLKVDAGAINFNVATLRLFPHKEIRHLFSDPNMEGKSMN